MQDVRGVRLDVPYLFQHLNGSCLFVQLLLLVFGLGLDVPQLLAHLGEGGLILGLLGVEVLQLGVQLLLLQVHSGQLQLLVL